MLRANELRGIIPPVPTPFDERGEIAPDKLGFNLERLAHTGLSGFVILGSNGEYVYLDESEKLALFETARQAIPEGRLFIAGTGAEATRTALRLTLQAARLGADAAIVITPAYYKSAMSGEALLKHFLTLAEASPIPIILYNMPAYTGLDMPGEVVLQLAQHSNIIGLKESSGNIVRIGELARAVAEQKLDFSLLAGSASFLQAALVVGASGGIVASANVAPQKCLELYDAIIKAGEKSAEVARSLQHELLPLNAAITTRYGVAGLKYAMQRLGLYGGPVRPPLLPLSDPARHEVEQLLVLLNLN